MNIQAKVKQTIKKYELIKQRLSQVRSDSSRSRAKEKILVALSGGKDSTLVGYLLHKLGYNIEAFHINLGLGSYSERCEKAVKKLCEDLGIKLHLYDFTKKQGSSMCYVRSAVQSKKSLKNCAICGVIKKWIINKEARRLKADKIATGHHLDDEAQTFYLNILKGAPELSANTGPIIRNISDKKFIPRIKPLFYCLEKDIKAFSKKNKLPVVYEPCPCALDSYRIQIRKIFEKFTDKEKLNIIKNFDKLQSKIKKPDKKISYCQLCGEPARKKICKKCELVKI